MRHSITILFFIVFGSFYTSIFAQSAEGTYYGERKRGKRHGWGRFDWTNGSRYEGMWKNDLMEGHGTLILSDGMMYEGNFEQGKQQGRGKQVWPNGDTYTGWFRQGKMEGSGRLKLADGSWHDGHWKNGEANGDGTHVWPSGTKYIGEWKDNKKHGQGIMYYYDGRIEQGSWENDQYRPCQCYTGAKDLTTAYKQADAVFLGKVISAESKEFHDLIEFEVSLFWKGNLYPGKRIFLKAGYSSCDYIFFERDRYLIFASQVDSRLYATNQCSWSKKEGEMGGLIAQLQSEVTCQADLSMEGAVFYAAEDWVCGCDGKTYQNPYEARKSGVGHWKEGKCK